MSGRVSERVILFDVSMYTWAREEALPKCVLTMMTGELGARA